MILKALTLENFKGICEPVRIEFSPLTLLFGPNNAGKSTILHALIYAREIFERGNIDPRRTEMGGDIIDLGGFDGMVYGHDRSRTIRMRFEFDVTADELLDAIGFNGFDSDMGALKWFHQKIDFYEYPDLKKVISNLNPGWIDIKISWNSDFCQPVVLECQIGKSDQSILKVKKNQKTDYIELAEINFDDINAGKEQNKKSIDYLNNQIKKITHQKIDSIKEFNKYREQRFREEIEIREKCEELGFELIRRPSKITQISHEEEAEEPGDFLAIKKEQESDLIGKPVLLSNLLKLIIKNEFFGEEGDLKPIHIKGASAVLTKDASLSFPSGYAKLSFFDKEKDNPNNSDWLDAQEILNCFLKPLLESISIGFIECCRNFLSSSLYLSSVRIVPPRDFHPVEPIDVRRWSSGLAAWDLISSSTNEELLAALNSWLNDEAKRFSSGYRIEIQRLKELDLADPLIARMIANEPDITLDTLREQIERLPEKRKLCVRNVRSGVLTAPQDIGYGVSQLLPVIVAALNTEKGIVAIEEPESNIHPAFQVMLADLFIMQTKANPGVLFLIETHSEHLMLRCLRRIRETQQGALAEDAPPPVLPDDIAVNFIEPSDQGPRIHRIRIDEDGDFADPWPLGFFPERFKELYGDDL